jgi:hypothetical protein
VPYVTDDPRVVGRPAPISSSVYYVTAGQAVLLFKFGLGDTDWCVQA